jgi:predicted small lipoprotein YifL
MSYRQPYRVLCLVLALVTASVLLAGCGQRGPLYLPDETEEQEEKAG